MTRKHRNTLKPNICYVILAKCTHEHCDECSELKQPDRPKDWFS